MVERFSKPKKEHNLLKESASVLLPLAAIGLLANAAISSGKRKDLKERASGVCEGCGVTVSKKDAIIGHMDHSDGPRYRVQSNLRVHCLACETKWHLTHVGLAKDIGLTEEGNDSTVIARLLQLLRKDPEKFSQLIREENHSFTHGLFLRFYFNEPELVDQVFSDNDLEFPVDLVLAVEEFAGANPVWFVFYYLKRQAAFDYFFETRDESLPLDLLAVITMMAEQEPDRYIQLYLGYHEKLATIFNQAGAVLPAITEVLTKLATIDLAKFTKIVADHPEIYDVIGTEVIENLLS